LTQKVHVILLLDLRIVGLGGAGGVGWGQNGRELHIPDHTHTRRSVCTPVCTCSLIKRRGRRLNQRGLQMCGGVARVV
jgi:hypothetical protein